MVEAVLTPRGRYALELGHFGGRTWNSALPGGEHASARQLIDGRVLIHATSTCRGRARPFHARDRRRSLGVRPALPHGCAPRTYRESPSWPPPAPRRDGGARAPARHLRAAHSVQPRPPAGARHPQRRRHTGPRAGRSSSVRACPSCAPWDSRRNVRAALVRLCRTLDLERLRSVPTEAVAARLGRERTVGPWTIGVVALAGLGRWDYGLVGDLGLVKLMSALRGSWVEPAETAELLAPYGEWQGLAGAYLLAGWKRGLVPGADPDRRAARAEPQSAGRVGATARGRPGGSRPAPTMRHARRRAQDRSARCGQDRRGARSRVCSRPAGESRATSSPPVAGRSGWMSSRSVTRSAPRSRTPRRRAEQR